MDTDGNGTVEWDAYLMAMYRKRQDARAKGSGLLEIFSQRKREAELKKEALLMEKQAAAEARLMSTEQDIALANARAAEAVVQRQVEIAQRNEEGWRQRLLCKRWRGRKMRRFERGPRPCTPRRPRAQCSRGRGKGGGGSAKGEGLCEKGAAVDWCRSSVSWKKMSCGARQWRWSVASRGGCEARRS